MPEWLFGALWIAIAGYGLGRGLYRLRRGLPVRNARSVDPARVAAAGRIELGMWTAFLLGGLAYLLVVTTR